MVSAYENDFPAGMKPIPGILSEIAEEAGYFFAENDERITVYQRTSNDPAQGSTPKPVFRVIATALKKDGPRPALINRLKSLVKGVPA